MKNKKNGFTLIELIVSITIIAVLTVAGVISYSGASKKARDSRRMADLEKIRIALELYRQGTGSSYPATTSALVPNYLQTVPTGPKGEAYTYTNSGYKYVLKTTLEETGVGYSITNP
ncbi:MAG: type II secretion system protein [Candidatus Shapirobacteria bacterium]|nr:type II secretion system protein [Candidatus Shapirobacteria bacterium]MDD4410386.1 type II secretion system protein [Candidatus Shapirobacteria bacterium]